MKKFSRKKGFTFVEMLVSVIVVAIIGATTYTVITGLTKTSEAIQKRNSAINLLQKSLEEVRRVGRDQYNKLESCVFGAAPGTPGDCGTEDTTKTLPEYTRTLKVTAENGNSDLKRAVVTVSFKEMGNPRELQSVVLIARPASSLPGNIYGLVVNKKNKEQILAGAIIHAVFQDGTTHKDAGSVSLVSTKNGNQTNFDFMEAGRYTLSPGEWSLTAEHPDFVTTDPPIVVNVARDSEQYRVIAMDPKSDDATITGFLFDQENNVRISNFPNGSIKLFESGSEFDDEFIPNSNLGYVFRIPMPTDDDERCFTIATNDAFRAGYVASLAEGQGCSFPYQGEGWSSSIFPKDEPPVCGNPYRGDSSLDRICISKNDPKKDVDLNLVPVPEAKLRGKVIDGNGNPVPGAIVHAAWPQSVGGADGSAGSFWLKQAGTDSNGNFVYFDKDYFPVPAAQGFFPNNSDNYMIVWAEGDITAQTCCQGEQKVRRSSQHERVGPLFPGDEEFRTFIISGAAQECGNVDGFVSDQETTSGISSANVQIAGDHEATTVGNYAFQCEDLAKFRLPAGSWAFFSDHPGYYPFNSQGNLWYTPQPNVNIVDKQLTHYNAKMWPLGRGGLTGIVKQNGSGGVPIAGALVELTLYDNAVPLTARTGTDGRFLFENVMETWPAVDLPLDDPAFRTDPLIHKLVVRDDKGYYISSEPLFIDRLPKNQITDIGEIKLDQDGGV